MTPLDSAALALAGRSFLDDDVTSDLAEIPHDRLSPNIRMLIVAVHEDLKQNPKADINRIIETADGKGAEWRELLSQAIAKAPQLDEARTLLAEALLKSSLQERDLPSTSKWPAPPGEAAYHGLAGEFVRLLEPATEGDPVAILVQFIVMLGNVLGRGPYVPIEADRHYTNLFAAIVGATSKGRKGISAGQSKRPLAKIDEAWASTRITGSLSSGEGFIWSVRDPIEKQEAIKKQGRVEGYQTVIEDPGETDKRLLVMEPELAGAIRYALLDQCAEIHLPHLLAAEALWKYCDASVKFIFGTKTGDPVVDEILGELQKAGSPGRSRNEIREYFGRHLRSEEIGRALAMLQEQGAAYVKSDTDTGGRPAERWYATIPAVAPVDEDAWEDGRE